MHTHAPWIHTQKYKHSHICARTHIHIGYPILTAYIHTHRYAYMHTDMHNTCVRSLQTVIDTCTIYAFASVHRITTSTHPITHHLLTLTGVARGLNPRDTNVCVYVWLCVFVCARVCECGVCMPVCVRVCVCSRDQHMIVGTQRTHRAAMQLNKANPPREPLLSTHLLLVPC